MEMFRRVRASRDPYDYRARDRSEGGNTSESTESIQNVNNMAVGEIGESGARSSFYTCMSEGMSRHYWRSLTCA